MSFSFRKPYDLILNRGTVSGSHTLDDAAIKRRSIQTLFDDLVGPHICIRDMAGDLR